MLTGLGIRDVVLIESLELELGSGLTVLTGETGGGKSIILDALGLATGARTDAGPIRTGAAQASSTAVFTVPDGHPVLALLEERGLAPEPGEDLILRRQLSADGRTRAFINDQAAAIGVLREAAQSLLEVHGQHETVGLLDARTHRPLLDDFGGLAVAPVVKAWADWRTARQAAEAARAAAAKSGEEVEILSAWLAELDRLDPREGEETELAAARALLGASEKALAEISTAKDALTGGDVAGRLGQAARALSRALERTAQAGVAQDNAAVRRLTEAAAAIERAMVEADEAAAGIDAAALAFDFDPAGLDKAEERLFALRAMARKLNVAVDALPAERARIARTLQAVEDAEGACAAADAEAARARQAYLDAASTLSTARAAAAERLGQAVEAELAPLKLERARFRVRVEPLPEAQAGPQGMDRVEFEIATNPGAPFAGLGAIASGGELARFALALKASLAGREQTPPVMIFDEVDQGVGGAVAEAVGQRLKQLAAQGQVLVVTHSPQIAARADAHWRVSKAEGPHGLRTRVDVLDAAQRQEEVARMLAGAEITDAARAAARALMEA